MIEYSSIVAFLVLFIHSTTQDGMIFGFVSRKLEALPAWIRKPLYDCPTCMSMYYGFPIQLMGIELFDWQVSSIWQAIMINACAAGINAAISLLRKDKPCNCDKETERKKRLGLL